MATVAAETTGIATYAQYIDGEWVPADSGSTYQVINPSTEEPLAMVAAGGREDARRAVAAARAAFERGEWRNKTQEQRTEIMLRIAQHIEERSDELALLESQNAGASLRKASVVDAPMAVDHWRVLASLALRLPWYEPLPWIDTPAVSWNFVQREPVGVCAGIVPWNFPIMMAVWKIAPALAMGNAIVLKPSPFTPLTALELGRIIDETGLLPKGVLNVVTGPGDELGEALVTDPEVDKVAFTGSTRVGRRIMAMAAETVKNVSLELGGKSANIVCADADLDIAVDGSLFATFFHQGQVCESGTRLFVHEDIYDAFMERLVATARRLRVGDATDLDTAVGPVVNRRQYEMILAAIERARAEGATVACGGGRPASVGERGYFIEPTVLTDVEPDSHVAREEIFGPVLAVQRWREEHDVIARANRSDYGLAGGIWSRNTRNAIEMAKRMRTGTVWINDWHLINALAPFGGYKQSGAGRELGLEGLKAYTEVKHIHVDQGVPRHERFVYDIVLGE